MRRGFERGLAGNLDVGRATVQALFNPLAHEIEGKTLACHNRYVESDIDIERWLPQITQYMRMLIQSAINQFWSEMTSE